MEFYTVSSVPRPVRLSDATRQFAWDSLHGKYGDEAMQTPFIALDDVPGIRSMTRPEIYNLAIRRIAEEAPIRICEQETVSGAATLGRAIWHQVPAYLDGHGLIGSISHLTIDFSTVVFCGVDSLEERIRVRRAGDLTPKEKETLDGMQNVIDAMHLWHRRYRDALKAKKPENYRLLERVPFQPARNFREAVTGIWFTFSFVRLCGNWPGIGRLDEMLGGFLEKDLADGVITLEEAREFLAGFFIKGCEWIQSDTPTGSGDAQHYQNLVLGGTGKDGCEVTNEVTYLILDIVEELGISDFPITVRIHENSPARLLRRVAEVMRHGGGVIAVYNEPLILKSLEAFGYSREEALQFANDGCWEVQIPGKTYFNYVPFDALQILLNDTLRLNTDTPAEFSSFEALYADFLQHLRETVGTIVQNRLHDEYDDPGYVISLFEDGCIENARSYLRGGPVYTICSPHIGGAPDAGNSLFAIDRLVFREKKISFAELMQTLRNNWEGRELLRQYAANKFTYYGNDDDEADGYTVRVMNDFSAIVAEFDKYENIRFPAGVSTFGRQIEWRCNRCATPFGRHRGDILSGNASPTPDTDFEGATAVIRSYCKPDLEKMVSGSALDVKLFPSTVEGENGLLALQSLLAGFVRLGGFFMQLDVIDAKILEEAQKHPEQYKTLSVRVSGWNARFVTLDKDWQQMIIERSSQNL